MANGQYVAPRVGAWIETAFEKNTSSIRKSHPVWVRGLKQLRIVHDTKGWQASHPVWVRGLKLNDLRAEITALIRRTPCGCVD